MNKIIKIKFVAVALLFLCGSAGVELLAEQKTEPKLEQKKDVSDPVLQEIIAAFGSKMPRFIDKHGKEVFVADAPVTRGTLMLALYEYDKSFKALKKDTVSKQEFADLASKVNQLQLGPLKQSSKTAMSADTMQLINDLMPNMPGILDSSLNNSKVFQNLKEQVAQRSQGTQPANEGQFKSTIDQTRYELQELVKKVDSLERSNLQPKNSDSSVAAGDTRNMLATTRTQLNKLEEKVNELEKRKAEPQGNKDISQIVNQLSPSMPALLDNSLNNSKVFQNLKEQIAQRPQGANEGQFKATLDQTKTQVFDLSKRLDSVEKMYVQSKKMDNSLLTTGDIKKSLAMTRVEMDRLEEKMSDLDKRKDSQVLNIDNSLNNSKVFQNLKEQVAQRPQGSNDGQFKTTLDQTRYELLDLAKRVDSMEKINSQTKNLETSGDIKRNLAMTRTQLEKLEGKVSDMEKRRPDLQVARRDNTSDTTDESKAYSSTLARISMGLSMVAALFIAR